METVTVTKEVHHVAGLLKGKQRILPYTFEYNNHEIVIHASSLHEAEEALKSYCVASLYRIKIF